MVLDVGALLGSLVGQSENNVRAALMLADATAPCGLYADELKKSIAGASSSGQTDSGVTARVFGILLTWLRRLFVRSGDGKWTSETGDARAGCELRVGRGVAVDCDRVLIHEAVP